MGGHYEGVPPPWPKQSFGIKWIPQGTCFRDWDMYILRGCTPPNAHFVGVDTWTWLGTGCQHQEHQVQSALSLKLSQGAGNCWFLCSNPGSLGFFCHLTMRMCRHRHVRLFLLGGSNLWNISGGRRLSMFGMIFGIHFCKKKSGISKCFCHMECDCTIPSPYYKTPPNNKN